MIKSATILLSLVALVLAATAFAGNGGGSGKSPPSSIDLVLVNSAGTATATASQPSYGDQVSFAIWTSATDYPYVNLKCYQNGALVGEGWAGFFNGALGDRTFRLYAPQWTGGAADCTAYLDMNTNGRWKQLASTSFHVTA